MSKKKILIVDDEADFCKLIKWNLESAGDFEVYVATEGRRGIALAKEIRPTLILLDITMPGMDGFKVLEKLKADEETLGIPVLMLTAKGDEASKTKASELYDDYYITKPIATPDLKNKIEEILKVRGIQ